MQSALRKRRIRDTVVAPRPRGRRGDITDVPLTDGQGGDGSVRSPRGSGTWRSRPAAPAEARWQMTVGAGGRGCRDTRSDG